MTTGTTPAPAPNETQIALRHRQIVEEVGEQVRLHGYDAVTKHVEQYHGLEQLVATGAFNIALACLHQGERPGKDNVQEGIENLVLLPNQRPALITKEEILGEEDEIERARRLA